MLRALNLLNSYMNAIILKSDADILKRMMEYKAAFRAKGKLGKIKESIKNFDLFKENLNFKKKTETPYGFNR